MQKIRVTHKDGDMQGITLMYLINKYLKINRELWAKVRENKIENNKHSKNGCRHEKATLAGTIYPFTSKKEDELKVICADCGVVLDDDPRKYMIEKGLWKIK